MNTNEGSSSGNDAYLPSESQKNTVNILTVKIKLEISFFLFRRLTVSPLTKESFIDHGNDSLIFDAGLDEIGNSDEKKSYYPLIFCH